MKIKELPQTERPREKLLLCGRENLTTAEVLAILVGSGSREKSALEVAMGLIREDRGGVRFLAECTPEELMEEEGIGSVRACTILAAVELGRRIADAPPQVREAVTSAQDVADLFMQRMRRYKKEHFISLLMNAKGEVIEEVKVSIGDLNSSTSHPREVFVEAVRRSAGSMILVHNHPSGDPAPSEADIETTARLMEVGELIGIPVLDHIIIGDGKYTSMKAEGYMGWI